MTHGFRTRAGQGQGWRLRRARRIPI